MKKLITLFCLFTVLCNAQTNVTYKTLNYDLQMRSLNGDSVSLFKKLAEGKTVIIDISATWCPPCWDFHKTRVLDSLHNRSDFFVMFIEADWSTPDSALYGKGSRTRGNWTDVNYPVFNWASLGNEITYSSYPTVYMILPDKRMYNISPWKIDIETVNEVVILKNHFSRCKTEVHRY